VCKSASLPIKYRLEWRYSNGDVYHGDWKTDEGQVNKWAEKLNNRYPSIYYYVVNNAPPSSKTDKPNREIYTKKIMSTEQTSPPNSPNSSSNCTSVHAVVIRPLVWTEHRKPNNDVGYDHCICDTPLGRFVLTWKSWKSQSKGVGFDETPWGEIWYGSWDEPDEAKQAAFDELNRRVALTIQQLN
jgi:hypothetical protein